MESFIGFLIVLGILAWYFVGMAGFVYWWTTEFDFTSDQILVMLTVGIMGPFSWLVGMDIHSEKKFNPKIFIKRRK